MNKKQKEEVKQIQRNINKLRELEITQEDTKEEKLRKVSKLVVLLINIEKQLNVALENFTREKEGNKEIEDTVERLKEARLSIQKTRLDVNYIFI